MAEIELQEAHGARSYERQTCGPKKTFSQDNDEQQIDVLIRLGKLPVLKVSSLSHFRGKLCGADSCSAISVSRQFWALRVPF